jgi:hypothetical protein
MIHLIHVNLNNIQEYIYDSIYQSIKIQPDLKIFVILEEKYITKFYDKINEFNINTNHVFCISTELLINDKIKKLYSSLDKFNLPDFRNNFWKNTIARFFYIESFMNLFKINNVYHLENDVMIYHTLQELKTDKIVLLKDSDTRVIASIMYIKNYTIIQDLINYLQIEIQSNVFKNDMELLGNYTDAIYFNTNPKNNKVYDGACLGQYIGGIDYKNINKTPPDLHTIYTNGNSGFVNETSDLKPNLYDFLLINGKYKINGQDVMNLHIHNKQLYNFSSFKVNFNQLISGDRVLSLCDFTFTTTQIKEFHKFAKKYNKHTFVINSFDNVNMDLINACILKKKSPIVSLFVYTHLLEYFIKYLFNNFTNKKQYIIYVHNSDHTFDDTYLSLLNSDKILKVYAQNPNVLHPKLTLLPIGIANEMWKHGNLYSFYKTMIDTYKLKKSKNVYININPNTYSYRKNLLDEIILQSGNCSKNKEYSEYLHELSTHYFCFCPRGNGIESHRFWESIYLGVVPIIINNKITNCENFTIHLKKLNIPFYEIKSDNITDIITEMLSLNKSDFIKFKNFDWLITLDKFKHYV